MLVCVCVCVCVCVYVCAYLVVLALAVEGDVDGERGGVVMGSEGGLFIWAVPHDKVHDCLSLPTHMEENTHTSPTGMSEEHEHLCKPNLYLSRDTFKTVADRNDVMVDTFNCRLEVSAIRRNFYWR